MMDFSNKFTVYRLNHSATYSEPDRIRTYIGHVVHWLTARCIANLPLRSSMIKLFTIQFSNIYVLKLVRRLGFEPRTYELKARYSKPLS